MNRAVKGPIVELAKIEVQFAYPGDLDRIPAVQVNHQASVAAYFDELAKYLLQTPPHLLEVPRKSGKVLIQVVIRNISKITIHNPTVEIISNVQIQGKTLGAVPFSDKAVNYEVKSIAPYKNFGEEQFITVEFQEDPVNMPADLTVIVEGDNMEPYSAIGNFVIHRF